MKKIIPLLIVFIGVGIAFYFFRNKKDDPNSYRNVSETLILPFDTVKVLAMMRIADNVNEVAKYAGEKNGALYPKIDTLNLYWMGPITDSPEWRYADTVVADEMKWDNDFYIEPADDALKISDYSCAGNRIQFIGREYGGKGFPKDFYPYGHYPCAGRVFKYYAYKIHKPFKVFGPNIQTNDEGSMDMAILTVK